jgi:hypothetical protein
MIDQKNKINIYGYKSGRLHVFDEVEVKYIDQDTTILLAKDIVRQVITNFSTALEKSLKNELLLDRFLPIGSVGRTFSEKTFMEESNDIFSEYWVWSTPGGGQTWLYNADDKIYLEISQIYPWLFSDPKKDEVYVSFDDYIDNYKPIALVELQKSLVQSWINQCLGALREIETV